MLSRWSQVTDVLGSETGLRSRVGRLLAALGFVAISPEVVAAARRSERRIGNQDRDDDESRGNQDDTAEKTRNDQESDRNNDSKTSTEGQDTSDKSEKSGKHDQDHERSGNDVSSDESGSDGGKSRSGDSSHRRGDLDSSSGETSADDNGSHHHGASHAQNFAQKADAPTNDASQDDVSDTTSATPANPNVAIGDVPDTSLNDLVVQGNDHVLASVSSSGGFAFARSGDVVAVSGPDGASIIQTGDVSTGTSGTNAAEPSGDGGNNDVSFAS